MERIEVDKAEWKGFCDAFSRRHGGWRVDISILPTRLLEKNPDAEVAGQRLSHDTALHGVTVEGPESQRTVTVGAGEPPQHLDHRVGRPLRMWLERDGAVIHGLRIDDREGRSLLIRFRVPATPERGDGIALPH